MKKNRLSLIVALLSVAPSLMGASSQTVYVKTSMIGPYELFQKDSTFEVQVISTYFYPVTTYEVIMFGNGNRVNDISINEPSSLIGPQGKKTYNVTIPTSQLMDAKGMTITIKVHNSTEGKDDYNKSIKIYPIGRTVVNPLNYPNNKIYNANKVCGLFDSTISYCNEFYTFPCVLDYFVSSTYYKLDISQFRIRRDSNYYSTNVGSATLSINGKNQFFPGMSQKEQNSCKIPLNVVNNGDILSLSFKGPMYVEPKMLIMSDFPISGFVQTNNFYLPINHIDDLNGTSVTFELSDIGFDKTIFRWNCSLSVSGTLLGRCSSSEYCVEGEVES